VLLLLLLLLLQLLKLRPWALLSAWHADSRQILQLP
jgi:hypothetical protein